MTETAQARPLTINLVSRDNGVGLSVDMGLLEGILRPAGHDVQRVDWRQNAMRPCDVAIFLELWNARLAARAKKVVGIFNLEWFQPTWARDLHRVHQLWAKSAEAHSIYQRLRLRTSTLTGFASRDLHDCSIPRTLSCLHVRGRSSLKSTDAVIEAWQKNPHLPPLTIISAAPLDTPPHIRLLGRVGEKQLRQEMNAASIHVCPSRAEGWGHYITEALSTGALVVTTNASPMNEHIHSDWGMLVQPERIGRRGMAHEYTVTARGVTDAVERAANITEPTRMWMSQKARQHFDQRNASFARSALELLARM